MKSSYGFRLSFQSSSLDNIKLNCIDTIQLEDWNMTTCTAKYKYYRNIIFSIEITYRVLTLCFCEGGRFFFLGVLLASSV